jgi:hypothetical protein
MADQNPQSSADTTSPQPPKQLTLQDAIDDLVYVIIRLTRRHPSDRKAIMALNRLQPDTHWERQLDAHEQQRLDGIGSKIAAKRASADEISDHHESTKALQARAAARQDAARKESA